MVFKNSFRDKLEHFNDPLNKHCEAVLENINHIFIVLEKRNKVILNEKHKACRNKSLT